MSVVKSCENAFLNMSRMIRRILVTYGEEKNIRKKANLINKVDLNSEQEKEIEEFFRENYGKRIPTSWHRLYQSYTGEYHKDYFPEILFSSKLEPITNPYRQAEFLGDKNLLEPFFETIEGLHLPETYISCVRGILRDDMHHIITFDEALEKVENLETYVIKKSVNTSSGRDVKIIKNGCKDLRETLKSFGNDFVVQELIKESSDLSKLNPTSLNTFRIITYFCEGKFYTCPVALRIGRRNSDRDNIHAGGISVGVNTDGTLKKRAYSEMGDVFIEHPDTHIIFENYSIEGAGDKIRSMAIKLHERMPWLGIISWDLAIDREKNIVLVEMNTTGQSAWFCQMVNGEPLFGENTEKMLKLISRKK